MTRTVVFAVFVGLLDRVYLCCVFDQVRRLTQLRQHSDFGVSKIGFVLLQNFLAKAGLNGEGIARRKRGAKTNAARIAAGGKRTLSDSLFDLKSSQI